MSPDSGPAETRYLYRFAHCELSEATGELRVRGLTVALPPRDRAVLFLLVRRAGEFVSNEEAAAAIWGDYPAKGKTVGNAVWNVRQAIGDGDSIIRNERNRGYVLGVPVERAGLAPAPDLQLAEGMAVPGRPEFVLSKRIGSGGYGDVWLCADAHNNHSVFKFSRESQHEAAIKREVTISRLLQASLPDELKRFFVPINEWDFEVWPSYIESPFAGENLRAWSQRQPALKSVPMAERLELMATVCEAVAAAHSVGVLHKDLKPENVLVEDCGSTRHIRLTDFGAGRLLARERAERLDITVRGWTRSVALNSASGTLLWMAPELFEGAVPTLQSDVYSLGVMLYQIVVGDLGRVLAPDWRPDVDDELLRDDIDVATRRDPLNRLADAAELARRLRSHSQRKAERARQLAEQDHAKQTEELLQRSKARRPYIWTAIAALVAGLATSSYFHYQQVRKTRIAESLSDFVSEDFLQAALPASGGTATITLKDAMLKAVPLARKRFAGQPELEANILTVFGNTLSSLGAYSDTVAVMNRLAELDAQLHGPSSADVLIDRMIAANSLLMEGEVTKAKAALDALKPTVNAQDKDPQVHGMWLQINSDYAFQMGHFDEAAEWNQKLAAFLLSRKGQPDFDEGVLIGAYLTSVESLVYAGSSAKAQQLGNQTLPQIQASLGTDSTYALLMQSLIASALRDQRHFDEAGNLFSTACPKLTEQLGADNKDAIGCLQNQAELYADMQRWNEAATLLQQVDESYSKVDGCERTSSCIDTDSDYALALSHAGRPEEALKIAGTAASTAETIEGLNETTRPHVEYVLGSVAASTGRLDIARRAASALQQALDANPEQAPLWAGHQLLLNARLKLAAGDLPGARRDIDSALGRFQQRPTRTIIDTNDATNLLAKLSVR